MCDPTTLFATQVGFSALESLTNYQGQSALYDQSVQQAQVNQQLANQSALGQYADLALRQTQEREAAAASVDDTARRATEARATARVSASEAGVAGASINALLEDYTRQEYDYQVRVGRNQANLDSQFIREREGVRSGLQSNLLNAQPIAKPNLLAQLPTIAGVGLQAFQSSFYDPVRKEYRFGDGE